MESMEKPASVFGMHVALAGAINALISTHPDRQALAAALSIEKQSSQALLEGMPIKEDALDGFHLGWKLLTEAPQNA